MKARDSRSNTAGNTDDSRGGIIPVAVLDADGVFLQAALTNEKGYRKSLEQGKLWTLHPETGRLLPFEGTAGKQQAASTVVLHRERDWLTARLSHTAAAGLQPYPRPSVKSPPEEETAGTDDAYGTEFLGELWKLIEERKAEMPEGSYTTYLFYHGLDKIRKKTGEEAVELILARGPEEIRHEAADLLYHTMVLLSAAGIELSQLIAELKERHGPR